MQMGTLILWITGESIWIRFVCSPGLFIYRFWWKVSFVKIEAENGENLGWEVGFCNSCWYVLTSFIEIYYLVQHLLLTLGIPWFLILTVKTYRKFIDVAICQTGGLHGAKWILELYLKTGIGLLRRWVWGYSTQWICDHEEEACLDKMAYHR